MRKHTQSEGSMTAEVQAASVPSYTDLFRKIDALQGKERQSFTRGLTIEEKRAYVKYCRERDCEMVTGVFRSLEPLGGTLMMDAMAYDGETPVKYTFFDGQPYTVPKYIAKRFENEFQGCGTWYPTNSHILDAFGKPIVNVGKKNRRFAFGSMDFQ